MHAGTGTHKLTLILEYTSMQALTVSEIATVFVTIIVTIIVTVIVIMTRSLTPHTVHTDCKSIHPDLIKHDNKNNLLLIVFSLASLLKFLNY